MPLYYILNDNKISLQRRFPATIYLHVCDMPAKFMACTGQKISSPDKTKQNIETFRPCIFLLSLQKAYICTPSTMKANMTAAAIPLPPGTAQNHQAKQTHDTASCHAATIALAEYSPARTSITTGPLRHISRKDTETEGAGRQTSATDLR